MKPHEYRRSVPELLRAAAQRLQAPGAHTTRVYARTADTTPSSTPEGSAHDKERAKPVCWCAAGAFLEEYYEDYCSNREPLDMIEYPMLLCRAATQFPKGREVTNAIRRMFEYSDSHATSEVVSKLHELADIVEDGADPDEMFAFGVSIGAHH